MYRELYSIRLLVATLTEANAIVILVTSQFYNVFIYLIQLPRNYY